MIMTQEGSGVFGKCFVIFKNFAEAELKRFLIIMSAGGKVKKKKECSYLISSYFSCNPKQTRVFYSCLKQLLVADA